MSRMGSLAHDFSKKLFLTLFQTTVARQENFFRSWLLLQKDAPFRALQESYTQIFLEIFVTHDIGVKRVKKTVFGIKTFFW
jgi:hypothetical protein